MPTVVPPAPPLAFGGNAAVTITGSATLQVARRLQAPVSLAAVPTFSIISTKRMGASATLPAPTATLDIPIRRSLAPAPVTLTPSASLFTLRTHFDTRAATVLAPAANDVATLFHTPNALTLSHCISHVAPAAASVTFSVAYGPNRDLAGTTLLNGIVCTSATTGLFTEIATAIPGNTFVWLTINGVTGTPTQFHLTLAF